MKKPVKYGFAIIAALIVIILSLDIQKLDKHNAVEVPGDFSAAAYTREVWNSRMPKTIEEAPEIISLLKMLEKNPGKAFNDFGRKLGISATYYFLASGEGIIQSVEEENLIVLLKDYSKIKLATGFIFGNTVRDGSGTVSIDDFVNMTDFNNVSVELNKMVKEEIVPVIKEAAQPGKKVNFTGTFEINEKNIDTGSIRIIPVSVKVSDGE
ncbi:MAG: DUF2291 domain-containing protein [Prolixibacteraceae bacterium]|nr:DUF2291 domain-containing protein [Prolixibacteraceae bacterium]